MKQAALNLNLSVKKTRKREFLEQMEQVVPWGDLVALIAPHYPEGTIGMLVAFQMFASKLSQPVMRLVGLWQQFQQASLAVLRLGDLMNAPPEPYSLSPSRQSAGQGRIEIDRIAFRYADDLPYLYENLSLDIEPGRVMR